MMDDELRPPVYPQFQRESYDALTENPFISTINDPLSTFSIDVDTASYANVRQVVDTAAIFHRSGPYVLKR